MRPLAKNIDVQVLCAQYSLVKTSIKQIASQLFFVGVAQKYSIQLPIT